MAVVIEAYTIVVRLDCIQGRLSHPTFEIPNSTALFDDHLWRCAFMAEGDARSFLNYLGKLGMKVEPGPDCEAVLVDEFELDGQPACPWLSVAKWDKSAIAWRTGTEPKSVIAREGWNPSEGSGLTREAVGNTDHLELLGEKDGVETYLNKNTGKKVYASRTQSPAEAMFDRAAKVIQANLVNPGGRPATGETAESVSKAVAELGHLLSLDPTRWNVLWLHGKGLMALGRLEEAYESLHKAYDSERNVEAVPRELAGICLELGKFEEAVAVAEQATLLSPEDAGSLGNLAIAQLLAGKVLEAKRSSASALEVDPDDKINLQMRRLILEVANGDRPQPQSLRELTQPAARKKPFWKFW